MNTSTSTLYPQSNPVSSAAEKTASAVDSALQSSQRATERVSQSVQEGLESARTSLPRAFTRAGEAADDLTRLGVEKAGHYADATVSYIRAEPVKAMLIAASAGAALAMLLGPRSR